MLYHSMKYTVFVFVSKLTSSFNTLVLEIEYREIVLQRGRYKPQSKLAKVRIDESSSIEMSSVQNAKFQPVSLKPRQNLSNFNKIYNMHLRRQIVGMRLKLILSCCMTTY